MEWTADRVLISIETHADAVVEQFPGRHHEVSSKRCGRRRQPRIATLRWNSRLAALLQDFGRLRAGSLERIRALARAQQRYGGEAFAVAGGPRHRDVRGGSDPLRCGFLFSFEPVRIAFADRAEGDVDLAQVGAHSLLRPRGVVGAQSGEDG